MRSSTAWDKVIDAQTKDPFFKKVIDSQKAWVKRTVALPAASTT